MHVHMSCVYACVYVTHGGDGDPLRGGVSAEDGGLLHAPGFKARLSDSLGRHHLLMHTKINISLLIERTTYVQPPLPPISTSLQSPPKNL